MKAGVFLLLSFFFCSTLHVFAQVSSYDGLDSGLNNLYRVSDARTRSISPENLTGEKGKGGMAKVGNASDAARDLGQGWKVNPFVIIEAGKTFTLGEIDGSGAIQHIWMTPTGTWRYSILRMYWDGEIFQPTPRSRASLLPVPSAAAPPLPFSPVKFSGEMERDRAFESRGRSPSPLTPPSNRCGDCARANADAERARSAGTARRAARASVHMSLLLEVVGAGV